MINAHFSWGDYVNVCKNHDVLYVEHDRWTLFGKDGNELRISKRGEIFFSKFAARSLHINEPTYFKGHIYGHDTISKSLVMDVEELEVDIDNFDKVVDKLNKLVPFA